MSLLTNLVVGKMQRVPIFTVLGSIYVRKQMSFFVCLLITMQCAHATSLVKGIDAAAMSSVRQLALATMVYNENFKSGKVPREKGPYPETLYGLVTSGILTKGDFQSLTQKYKITYFRPALPDGDPELPILYARSGETTILGFLSGQVTSIPDPPRDQSHWFILTSTLAVLSVLVGMLAWTRTRKFKQRAG